MSEQQSDLVTVPEADELDNRVSSGIVGLDEMIEGGFPRGSLILLAGSPGSGKTIASAHFLYHGAKNLNECGIYLSFGEHKEFFYENLRKFGFDFEPLESQGKFKFLDLLTTREDTVSSTLGMLSREVLELGAKRLVVDSFTAMAQAFNRRIDARIILHMLDKLMGKSDCTTLLLVELPTGTKTIGLGFEEFVADGVILFETIDEREGIRKRAVVRKMRGTNHNMNYSHIVISDHGISLMPYIP
ncbi:MAG TPA: ATPase domain-containing protein [Candidatus Bathyarchaeia archaeon]|nr:ATPase domain-containing protein [Candidatus Bathyarchaeia archaeon]